MQKKILVQFCRDCKAHSWNTRHDQSRYMRCYIELKNYLQKEGIQTIQTKQFRLGSFQITIDNYQIFSKSKSKMFPNIEAVGNFIIQFFKNPKENLEKYSYLLKNLQRSPSNQNNTITLSPSMARTSQFSSPNKFAKTVVQMFNIQKQLLNSRNSSRMISTSFYRNKQKLTVNTSKIRRQIFRSKSRPKTLKFKGTNPEQSIQESKSEIKQIHQIIQSKLQLGTSETQKQINQKG